jgi:hypothetical protein
MHQRVKYIGLSFAFIIIILNFDFRRILDALRNVFKIKNTYGLSIAEKELCLSRQYSQIRYILHSLNYIDANMTKELKGELSTR